MPSRIIQAISFTSRAFLQLVRSSKPFFYNCLLVVVASFLVSWAFRNIVYKGPVSIEDALTCPTFIRPVCFLPQTDDNMSFSLMICLSLGLTAMTSSLPTFKEERLIYKRERSSGMSTLAYFIAKNLAEIPSLVIQPIFYLVVMYYMTTLIAPLWMIYLTLLGIQFASMGLGYVAATFAKPNQSFVLGVVLIFVSIILSGQKPTLKEWENEIGIAGKIIPSISYARWGMECFYLAQVELYKNIYTILPSIDLLGYAEGQFWLGIFIMFVLGFVFRILAYLAVQFL